MFIFNAIRNLYNKGKRRVSFARAEDDSDEDDDDHEDYFRQLRQVFYPDGVGMRELGNLSSSTF